MSGSDAGRHYLPHSQVAKFGDIPERSSREAVIHLARLAKSNAVFDGRNVAPRLSWLAEKLNAKLSPDTRVTLDELRDAPVFDGDARAIGEFAVATIGEYVTNPAVRPILRARQKGLITLERYFTWCRGLWLAVESSRAAVDAFRFDQDTMPPVDDIGEHSLGAILHWLASLCVVIEGWEELELHDQAVDQLLASGGDAKTAGTLRYRLQRLRNGVFHFQSKGTDDARFTDFWNNEVTRWAIPLERAFERFFRHVWETQHESVDVWLHRGLDRYDPEFAVFEG